MGWNIKYSELLTLSVEQPFYQNNICPNFIVDPYLDFNILPTPESAVVMRRFDMVFKKMEIKGGFVILGRTNGDNRGNPLLQFKPGKGIMLTFVIFILNPSLLNFNDLPFLLKDQVYFFSNQIADPAASRNNLHLTKDASGVMRHDIIKKSSATYAFQKAIPIALGTSKVKHLGSGKELLPKTYSTEGGMTTLTFDLSSLAPGKCQLLENGSALEEFYFMGNKSHSQIFGIIELSLDATLLANYRIIETDGSLTLQRPAYKIGLITRKTIWRYTLLLQPNNPLLLEIESLSPVDKTDFINRLNVISNDTSITFSNTMINDTRFEFLADNPIQLQEKYLSSMGSGTDTLQLSLKKYIGDVKEEPIKSSLPYPSTSRVDSTNEPLIYSDILLTL